MNLFYLTDFNSAVLSGGEFVHCIKSFRYKEGDTVRLFNGAGVLAEGVIGAIYKSELVFKSITILKSQAPAPKRFLAFGIPKAPDRLAFILEKCTELGITDFMPLVCQNSVKLGFNHDRAAGIVLAACKQSQCLFLPTIWPLMSPSKVFETVNVAVQWYRGDQVAANSGQFIPGENLGVFIGPEGDFSDKEVKFLSEKNVIGIKFGANRLRTETAAMAIASLWHAL